MNKIREAIIEAIPKGTPFRVHEVADKVFPDLLRTDAKGRTFNQGSATVSYYLTRMEGVIVTPGRKKTFLADPEYFKNRIPPVDEEKERRDRKSKTFVENLLVERVPFRVDAKTTIYLKPNDPRL